MSENRLSKKAQVVIIIICVIVYILIEYLSKSSSKKKTTYYSSNYGSLPIYSIYLFDRVNDICYKYKLIENYKSLKCDDFKCSLSEHQMITFIKCYWLIFKREQSESYGIISHGLDLLKNVKVDLKTVNIDIIHLYYLDLLNNFMKKNDITLLKHFARFLLIEIDKDNNVKLNIEGLNIRDPFYDELSKVIKVESYKFLSPFEVEEIFRKRLKDGRYEYSYMDIALRIWYYYYINLLVMFDKPEDFLNPKEYD